MKFKLFHFLAGIGILLSCQTFAQTTYGLPSEIKDGNILHCFDWKINDVKNSLPSIAQAGFVAIQISPLQCSAQTGYNWSDLYRPYDFAFRQNGIGTSADLTSLCQEAEKYGIKIIVDVIFNHVDNSGYHDSWWDSNGRLRTTTSSVNYNNRNSITHDRIGDFPEVNSENSEVAERAKAYIEELKGYGVKGIRFDAAKHIALPSEGCDFWKVVTSVPDMFYYGEILSSPGGSNGKTLMKEYTDYMYVTDDDYSSNARSNGGVPSTTGNWALNGIEGSKLVYWGESHDTYSNTPAYGGVTKNVSQAAIDRAYAIVACRNEGIALYFSRPNYTDFGDIKVGQKGSTHFTERPVAEINKFKNAMVGKEDYYSYNSSTASITRKDGGAVIVNRSGSGNISVANGGGYCPPGTYVDRVSGGTFTVTSETITGYVGSSGIAVIYGDYAGGGEDPDPVPDNDIYIYYTNPDNWGKVCVYMYLSGGAALTNGNWPGDPMIKNGDFWEYRVPSDLTENSKVIFNDGGNGRQDPQDEAGQECGYDLYGVSMIYDGKEWKEYVDSGINDITDETFDLDNARWFTIQGIEIGRPSERGIYIVVSPEGKTKKIFI